MKTKKITILLILFSIFINSAYAIEDLHCDTIPELGGLCFDVTFATTTDFELKIPSKYNFPYFSRMGDYLYIKDVKIFNLDNNSNSSRGEYTLNIRPSDYIDKPYTDLKKTYPEDYGRFIFYLGSLPPKFICELTIDFAKSEYETDCQEGDVKVDRLSFELFKEGEWVIVDTFEPTRNRESGIRIEQYGHTSIFNGKWKGNTFKVTSGFEMDNFRDLKTSLRWVLISILATALFTLLSIYLQFKSLTKNEEEKLGRKLWLIVVGIVLLVIASYFILRRFI